MIHVAAIAPIKLASASHISKYLPEKNAYCTTSMIMP